MVLQECLEIEEYPGFLSDLGCSSISICRTVWEVLCLFSSFHSSALLCFATKVVVYHVRTVLLSSAPNGGLSFLSGASISLPDLGILTHNLLPEEECHIVLGKPTSSTSSFPVRTCPASTCDFWNSSLYRWGVHRLSTPAKDFIHPENSFPSSQVPI